MSTHSICFCKKKISNLDNFYYRKFGDLLTICKPVLKHFFDSHSTWAMAKDNLLHTKGEQSGTFMSCRSCSLDVTGLYQRTQFLL